MLLCGPLHGAVAFCACVLVLKIIVIHMLWENIDSQKCFHCILLVEAKG